MLRLVVNTFMTLDGVMQSPGDSEEDAEAGFKYGGRQMPYHDAGSGAFLDAVMAETAAMLLCRRTYQIFAGYWPTSEVPITEKMKRAPKYMVPTTLKSADWINSTLIRGNLPEEIPVIKAQAGTGILLVSGSGKLVQSLMKEKLVDEHMLWFHPPVPGTGKRLFEDGVVSANLELNGYAEDRLRGDAPNRLFGMKLRTLD